MCSFGVSSKDGLLQVNQFTQRRGPDQTNVREIEGIHFLHNLLHLTGEYTPQPLTTDTVAMVFNGEIYNYKEFGEELKTDGEAILAAYRLRGDHFAKYLDGEFAICLVNFSSRKLIITTDTFATKPLWYEFTKEDFCVGSYKSQLTGLGFSDPKKLLGNMTYIFDLDTYQCTSWFSNHQFDIKQYKSTFDDWISAFERSIEKRSRDLQYGCFLGLSSGYDSGAIACELLKQKVDFKSYSIVGPENKKILQQRVDQIPNHELINFTRVEYDQMKHEIQSKCEDFKYKDKFLDYDIKGDKASFGLAAICKRANSENRRVYFSGQGADEIISDYGFNGNKIYAHSSFGGKFPVDLYGFWPWHSFFGGTQIQYLNKEEYVAGHFGIETRYPFLDVDLVQEFLWLSPALKNSKYKSALDEYLKVSNFPYSSGEKIGFNTLKGLQ